jgi:hypothetical protein
MFKDIVLPEENEEEFISFAKRTGTKALIFLYEKHDKSNIQKIKELKKQNKDFILESAVLVEKNHIKGYDYNYSLGERQHFESKRTDLIYSLERMPRKDSHHYRQSGMNHITAKLAAEKEIVIAFNFNDVLKAKDKGKVLGRMKQNVMLCKKYKVLMKIASFAKKPIEMKTKKDLESFGRVLGKKD